jgi:hypothetical protein
MNRHGSALKTTVAGITVAWLSPFLGYLYGQTKTENRPASTVGIERLKKLSEVVPPERLIKADGFQTYFVQNGQNGPEILLLHGFGSSTFTWRKNLEALGKIGRVTAIDIKGFGLTGGGSASAFDEAFDIFRKSDRGGRLIGRFRIHVLILRLGAHIPL